MEIKKAALVGFGAIGCVYAKNLIKSIGDNFVVIAGGSRAERIRSKGVIVNGEEVKPRVVEPESTDYKADLVIFTVKNYHLAQALKDVENVVDEHTIFLTVLNGVTARDEIKAAYPNNTVLYGIGMGIVAVRSDEGIKCRCEGTIQFGEADNTTMSPEVKAVKDLFDAAGIGNEVFPDMIRTIWNKFMINVSTNQLSAITGAGYGHFLTVPELNNAMHQVMTEVITLANKKGINLTEDDAYAYEKKLATFDPVGKTSMLQDVVAKCHTEVDYFAGTVIKFGKEAGVPTPWNDRMYLLIKTIEGLY